MINQQTQELVNQEIKSKSIKCVVWDLDNTLWHGVLLEDPQIVLFQEVVDVIKGLDRRGILNSIASRNDPELTMSRLQEFGLSDFFLYPQINWNSKASSIKTIAQLLNLDLDSFAFVDDQPFEREEVAFEIPNVLCIDAKGVHKMLGMPEMMPHFITADSRLRRKMYQSDIIRNRAEQEFIGSNEDFLATLDMVFSLGSAKEDDLQRAEELTVRTHQLNTTGYTYSYEEFNALRQSGKHKLLIASLDDKYGTYGKVGLALVECGEEIWTIKLLLMSCRVISRGVGTIMMNYILSEAKKAGVRVQAEFISNNRNRMMYITYKFGGFHEVNRIDDLVILGNDLSRIQPVPDYVKLKILN